jgi:hypothetical protein
MAYTRKRRKGGWSFFGKTTKNKLTNKNWNWHNVFYKSRRNSIKEIKNSHSQHLPVRRYKENSVVIKNIPMNRMVPTNKSNDPAPRVYSMNNLDQEPVSGNATNAKVWSMNNLSNRSNSNQNSKPMNRANRTITI